MKKLTILIFFFSFNILAITSEDLNPRCEKDSDSLPFVKILKALRKHPVPRLEPQETEFYSKLINIKTIRDLEIFIKDEGVNLLKEISFDDRVKILKLITKFVEDKPDLALKVSAGTFSKMAAIIFEKEWEESNFLGRVKELKKYLFQREKDIWEKNNHRRPQEEFGIIHRRGNIVPLFSEIAAKKTGDVHFTRDEFIEDLKEDVKNHPTLVLDMVSQMNKRNERMKVVAANLSKKAQGQKEDIIPEVPEMESYATTFPAFYELEVQEKSYIPTNLKGLSKEPTQIIKFLNEIDPEGKLKDLRHAISYLQLAISYSTNVGPIEESATLQIAKGEYSNAVDRIVKLFSSKDYLEYSKQMAQYNILLSSDLIMKDLAKIPVEQQVILFNRIVGEHDETPPDINRGANGIFIRPTQWSLKLPLLVREIERQLEDEIEHKIRIYVGNKNSSKEIVGSPEKLQNYINELPKKPQVPFKDKRKLEDMYDAYKMIKKKFQEMQLIGIYQNNIKAFSEGVKF